MKNRSNPFLRHTLAASLVLSMGLIHSAQAAALTWDATTGTTGAQDGGGTWTTAAGNWRNTTTPTDNVNWTASDTATFGAGTDGTYAVTVGGAISATAINFVNSGYTLSASSAQTITVASANALSVSSGKSATIGNNVTITRSGGYSIVGGGALTISGTDAKVTNTSNHSMGIIRGTTIEVGTGGIFSNTGGGSSSIVVGNDATNGAALNVTGGTVTTSGNLVVANNTGSAMITLTSGQINQTLTSGGTRFGGSTSTGTFNLDGGTLTTARIFEAATGVSSTFYFNNGTLKVTSASANAGNFMAIDNAYIKAGGAKIDTNGVATTIAQVLQSGVAGPTLDGGLTLNDTAVTTGTLTLSGANTYTGLTTVTAGALNITSTGSLNSGNALTVGAGGTAEFANAGQNLEAVSNSNTATNALNFSASTGTVTLASLAGAGNTRFGSHGTVTGGISTGTVSSVGALNADISGGTIAAGGLLTGTISSGTVGAGSLSSTSVTGGTNTITGVAGITTLNGGTTTVGGIATISTMSSGTANLNGATSAITTLNGGTVNLGSSTVLTVNNGTTSGSITGSGGGLTKSSGGTLNLTAANSYTGDTTVSEGTLSLGDATNNTALENTAKVFIASGAILNLDYLVGNTDTVKELWIGGVQKPAGVYSVSDPSGQITGSGTLTVTTSPASADPFASWIGGPPYNLSGPSAAFDFDYDNDGIKNGLEWILGGNPTQNDTPSILPVTTGSAVSGLTLVFNRATASLPPASSLVVDFDGDLDATWAKSVTIGAANSGPDANGVTVAVDTPSVGKVTVTIPASNAVSGKLFSRLRAVKP